MLGPCWPQCTARKTFLSCSSELLKPFCLLTQALSFPCSSQIKTPAVAQWSRCPVQPMVTPHNTSALALHCSSYCKLLVPGLTAPAPFRRHNKKAPGEFCPVTRDRSRKVVVGSFWHHFYQVGNSLCVTQQNTFHWSDLTIFYSYFQDDKCILIFQNINF